MNYYITSTLISPFISVIYDQYALENLTNELNKYIDQTKLTRYSFKTCINTINLVFTFMPKTSCVKDGVKG